MLKEKVQVLDRQVQRRSTLAEEAPQGPQRTPNPPKRGPLALRNMAKEEEKAGEQAEKALKKRRRDAQGSNPGYPQSWKGRF